MLKIINLTFMEVYNISNHFNLILSNKILINKNFHLGFHDFKKISRLVFVTFKLLLLIELPTPTAHQKFSI